MKAMTSNDLLGLILAAADDQGRVFDHAEIATWPPDALEEFQRRKLIQRGPGGLCAPCPNCDGAHTEPVTVRAGPDGQKHFYIWCPRSLRVEVEPEMCDGWQVDLAGLAASVAGALVLKGKPKPIVPDRFWRLGRTPWPPGSSNTREVVLALRMHEHDASAMAANVKPDGSAIVFVPNLRPDHRVWPGKVPAVIVLSEVMRWHDQGLAFDAAAVVDDIRAADATPYTVGGLTISDSELKSMIRRQVKADKKSELPDEAMVAAYNLHGTTRAAAAALQEEGYQVHHSTIARKVKAAEEAGELARTEDSPSVARTVASQRRDRVKKIVERQ